MAKPKRKPKSEVVVPQAPSATGRLAARLIWILSNMVAATLRFRWQDDSGAFETEPDKPIIFCIWHNRIAMAPILYRNFMKPRWPHRRTAGMVSASRDGGMFARILELFGMEAIRGSSSRRGAQALRDATKAMRNNLDLAITPDGPRGPRYEVQPGVISIAQITGCRIIPASCRLSWKITLRSWDRFQIPLPFSKCEVHFGKAVDVPRKLTPEEFEAIRNQLQSVLKTITVDE